MHIIRRQLPDRPNYAAACCQTVTLFNIYKVGTVTKYHRSVFHESAYLESKRITQESRTGVTATNRALLVIPAEADGKKYIGFDEFDLLEDKTGYFTIRALDKVIAGEWPEITTVTEWGYFIPAKINGVVTIADKDEARNLAGVLVHVEAGG